MSHIQDKLLEKHICRFNDGECKCDCYIAGMTDYHNHIVEKIDILNKEAEKFVPFQKIHYQSALNNLKSLLQDTNKDNV